MKSLVVFYSICLMALYSVLTFIGYRKEKFGHTKESVLAEVTVTAKECKTAESRLVAQHFDNALACLKKKQKNEAAEEIYDALLIFTTRSLASGNYNRSEFHAISNNLAAFYRNLRFNREVPIANLKKTFECAELFIAEGFIVKSSGNIKEKHFGNALKDINSAEESIALATKYSGAREVAAEKRIFNTSRKFLNVVISEMNLAGTSSWRKFLNKMNHLEGSSV